MLDELGSLDPAPLAQRATTAVQALEGGHNLFFTPEGSNLSWSQGFRAFTRRQNKPYIEEENYML